MSDQRTSRSATTRPDVIEALAAIRRIGLCGDGAHAVSTVPENAAVNGRPRELAPALLDVLVTPYPIPAIEAMARCGLLALLLPEVEALRHMPAGRHKDVYRHTLQVVARTPSDPITRLAALLHDIGKPATKVIDRGAVHFPGHAEVGAEMTRRRLRALGFDRETNHAVTLLVALHLRVNSYEADWTDSAARRLAREAGEQFDRLLDLSRADVTSARREAVERALRRVDALDARVAELRAAEDRPESPLNGEELMAMFGRPPGRWIGEVKSHLAALVGDGGLAPDDKVRAGAIARGLLADMESGA
jgi:poly(A) polymerase